MDLLVETPIGRDAEREYILSVVLNEFLGISWRRKSMNRTTIRITALGASGELILPDVLFSYPDTRWLQPGSLPKSPLPSWDGTEIAVPTKLTSPCLPVIFGDQKPRAYCSSESIYLPIDVFGSAFFMLTRYEEIVNSVRDAHGRFPASASIAYQEGFLERPIIDEYVEVLWATMKRLWPGIKRKDQIYCVCLSHDVDHPAGAVNKPWLQVLRNVGGDLIRRKDTGLALRRLKAKLTGDYSVDPFNTFAFIMDLSERHGLRSAFYFKTGFSNRQFDENYSLDSPWMEELLRNIHERGHEIGLHTSYEAYNDPIRTRNEFEALLRVADKLHIVQKQWGGRQHYLRWENPVTWQIWEEAGLDYDSTLGFADHVGFRCGTCHEFPVFNLRTRKALRLRERPLIVMDTTLLAPEYMALRPEQALEWIERLSNTCRRFGGTFTLLWHNTNLSQSWQRKLYLEALEVITWIGEGIEKIY